MPRSRLCCHNALISNVFEACFYDPRADFRCFFNVVISVPSAKLVFSLFIPFYPILSHFISVFGTSGLTALFVLDFSTSRPNSWSLSSFFVFTFSLLSVRVSHICAFVPEPGCSFALCIARISRIEPVVFDFERYIKNRASLGFSLFTRLNGGGPCGFQLVEPSLRWRTEAKRVVISFDYRSVVVGYWMIKTMPLFAALFQLFFAALPAPTMYTLVVILRSHDVIYKGKSINPSTLLANWSTHRPTGRSLYTAQPTHK